MRPLRQFLSICLFGVLAFAFFSSLCARQVAAPALALKPPLGWNSWDGYGTTINEAQVKSNAEWFSKNLKPYGWQYIVVDMEWFVTNPTPEGNSKSSLYSMDSNGRYIPAVNRFPSSQGAAGFKPFGGLSPFLGLEIRHTYSEGNS